MGWFSKKTDETTESYRKGREYSAKNHEKVRNAVIEDFEVRLKKKAGKNKIAFQIQRDEYHDMARITFGENANGSLWYRCIIEVRFFPSLTAHVTECAWNAMVQQKEVEQIIEKVVSTHRQYI